MINVFRAPDKNGHEAIAAVLAQDAMFVTEEGDPFPGVALHVQQAREIAYRLLLFAQEIENGRPIRFHSADSTNRFNRDARQDGDGL